MSETYTDNFYLLTGSRRGLWRRRGGHSCCPMWGRCGARRCGLGSGGMIPCGGGMSGGGGMLPSGGSSSSGSRIMLTTGGGGSGGGGMGGGGSFPGGGGVGGSRGLFAGGCGRFSGGGSVRGSGWFCRKVRWFRHVGLVTWSRGCYGGGHQTCKQQRRYVPVKKSLRWRHNERRCVSNHRQVNYLFNWLFRITSQPLLIVLCEGTHRWQVGKGG